MTPLQYFAIQPDFNQFVIGVFLVFTTGLVLHQLNTTLKLLLHFLAVLIRGWPNPTVAKIIHPLLNEQRSVREDRDKNT